MLSAAYVLALMLHPLPMFGEPPESVRATYERTAEAIAELSEERPLFAGEDGPARTAAVVVAVGRFESGLRPDAEGDCDRRNGTACVRPRSFCLLQINETNFAGLRTTRKEIQEDIRACVRAGLAMMRESFRICRAVPIEEKLAWYAAGSGRCGATEDAKKKSRHRMIAARLLFDAVPRSSDQGLEQ